MEPINTSTTKTYKCVRCGEPATALFKQYSPSVLKLTKCEQCHGLVDKYVEYDPVIVMIDLILMSKEAHRHIIYNTQFKSYWKVFILLMMLETYGLWKNDSLTTIALTTYCAHNYTHYNGHIIMNENTCQLWANVDSTDIFITEKNFYVLFVAVLLGIGAFTVSTQILMWMTQTNGKHNVSLVTLTKAFSLSNVSLILTLPALIWGSSEPTHLLHFAHPHLMHYLLVFLYSSLVFHNVYSVVYERPLVVTAAILTLSHVTKLNTILATGTYLKQIIK